MMMRFAGMGKISRIISTGCGNLDNSLERLIETDLGSMGNVAVYGVMLYPPLAGANSL